MHTFTIGRLARATGCKVQTVRYYEQIGLMPRPPRSAGNQRLYGPEYIDRLVFIRHARDLGFSLEAISDLLGLSDRPEQSCAAADRIARHHLEEVERKITRLEALRAELYRMTDQCQGGRIADCRIINALADHSLCLAEDHSA